VGTETIKVVELSPGPTGLEWRRRQRVEHHKDPARVLETLLEEWAWSEATAAAVTGTYQGLVRWPAVPVKQAQARGCRFLLGDRPATVVSIGSRGFSVLELRPDGVEVWRANSRCSQGTGNFLRQLLERLSLSVEEADALAAHETQPAVLSARCPVILKTDVTHLANRGESRARIVAGCFDAVGENVQAFLKPGRSPDPIVLIGGVAQSVRIRQNFRQHLERLGLTLAELPEDAGLYLEALGCALVAASTPDPPPLAGPLLRPATTRRLERVPALASALARVRRLPAPPLQPPVNGDLPPVFLGLDIGSTGSKAVAVTSVHGTQVWHDYRPTAGDPVGAALALVQQWVAGPAGRCPVLGVGVTGSGREIAGALLTACYGAQRVFLLNEIAAHAAGAVSYDARVDTIFEIGGQDAKYIRLADGRVVDCAMNEACSAGTGSFLEEQGRKFQGVTGVGDLEREALRATHGVSLGQHCSVFMAEMIDQAVLAGVEQPAIIAGLYDSVIQNYLHRVKGNRPVGHLVFCQGMPFTSDALAAAVARQTDVEVVVPPHPGMVGALGIALLARTALDSRAETGLELDRFLAARVTRRDAFQCRAAVGCGGTSQHCRIEQLHTLVAGQPARFTWGGACGLHDRAFQRRRLPSDAPDPFREREERMAELATRLGVSRGRPRVALTDEFLLPTHFPFFARFLHELGQDLVILRRADRSMLKRGIQRSNVPFCAPLQLFHGIVAALAATDAERVFIPRLRHLPTAREGLPAVNCPVAQAGADVVGWDLAADLGGRLLSPPVDFGPDHLHGSTLLEACRQLAHGLGANEATGRRAHQLAVEEQRAFDQHVQAIGQRALAFAHSQGLPAVVVLGRPYTIHNPVLNSNVPAILREQGALALPGEAIPLPENTPEYAELYWGHGRRILRTAHAVRHQPGAYAVFCSNYSCGPDSLCLPFCSHLMQGKPFLIIETDGHAGDAGTRTRVEAFLHCVQQDFPSGRPCSLPAPALPEPTGPACFETVRQRGDTLLLPWMGHGPAVLAACFRAFGLPAESLPLPDAEALRLGRRHTSGKECLPLCLTLGNFLKRLYAEPDRRFTLALARSQGPCRLGMYHWFDRLVLDELGWRDRVQLVTPCDEEYFAGTPPGFAWLTVVALMAHDLLQAARLDVAPIESVPGSAEAVYQRYLAELIRLCDTAGPSTPTLRRCLAEVLGGRWFGIRRLLARAADEFAALRTPRAVPTVLVVGEIYVRLDPFANHFLTDTLEQHGVRALLAPLSENLEYSNQLERARSGWPWLRHAFGQALQERLYDRAYAILARRLGWPPRLRAAAAVAAARDYLQPELEGEAILTIGAPLEAWRAGQIAGAINVGPLECLPTKIAEAQLFHAAAREGLPTLTLTFNGEPPDPLALESFLFEVKERFRRASEPGATGLPTARPTAAATPGLAR
jgi:activator of 2-hydroxyglutaryl-CoA dehydratase/predicted nucleotide-binding protein (sugar kinase/HSP70/actin superfamily)